MQSARIPSGHSWAHRLSLFALICVSTAQVHAQTPWVGSYIGLATVNSRSVINGSTVKADGTVGASATNESATWLHDQNEGYALQLGYRKRLESGFIVGFEGDAARLGHKTGNQNLIDTGIYAGQPSAKLQYEIPWLVTTRAVAGWAVDDLLVFGSAGAAFAPEKVTRTQFRAVGGTSVTEAQFSESDRGMRQGFAVGTGMEWRWAKSWAVRGEYLHVRFPDKAFQFPDARGGAQGAYSTVQGRIATNDARLNIFRLGLTYLFDAGH